MIWVGVVLALVTSLSWGLGNVLTQRVGRLVGPPRAMVWSLAAGGLLATPCALLFDERTAAFDQATLIWTAVSAIAGVVAYVGLFFAFAHEGLAIAVPIVSAWPLVSGAVSVLLLGERVEGLQLVGASLVLVGVILVSLPRKARAERAGAGTDAPAAGARWALHAAFASAVGFGVMVPAMARIAPATGAFGATVVVFALGITFALVVGGAVRANMRPPQRSAWVLVLATGAAETAGFVTVSLARRFAPMALVAPVASLSSTLTVLYAWIVLGERPSMSAAAGALLAGVGVAILAT